MKQHCDWEGRREMEREESSTTSLGTSFLFYGSNETVPFPKQAPRVHVYLIPVPTTPKAACQPNWPSKGNMARFTPDYCTVS